MEMQSTSESIQGHEDSSTPSCAVQQYKKALVTMGACTALVGKLSCPCQSGSCVSSAFPWADPPCENCEHLMSYHTDYDRSPSLSDTPPSPFPVNPDYSERSVLTKQIFDMVVSHHFVYVRSPPLSGKTVLAHLIFNYVLDGYLNGKWSYIPIFITWVPKQSRQSAEEPWKQYLRSHSPSSAHNDFDSGFHGLSNIMYIIDEGQNSFQEIDFWLAGIKSLKDLRECNSGPRVLLFSSFGSPTNHVLEIEGSSPIDLGLEQRVSLLPSIDGSSDVGICFTFEEVQDVYCRMRQHKGFQIEQSALRYLFAATNGHPGLTYGLLDALCDDPELRASITSNREITLIEMADYINNEKATFKLMRHRVIRGIPVPNDFHDASNANLRAVLVKAVKEHGVAAWWANDLPGLEDAYHKGWLHATSTVDNRGIEDQNVYSFPSEMHHNYAEWLLFPEKHILSGISLKELCFAALKRFSPTLLVAHAKKIQRIPGAENPNAQYVFELYRCLHDETGGKATILAESSFIPDGRVDLVIKEPQWGIRCLKDIDWTMPKHTHYCSRKFRYIFSPKDLEDRIVLNFCQSTPPVLEEWRGLYHVLFDAAHESYQLLDHSLNVIDQVHLQAR